MSSESQSAAAARRATAVPGVFVIPRDQLPPGFAERVDTPPDPPPPARAAATVVLLREAAAGCEVLLMRRPLRSRFAADAWVFPGGAVDAADADAALDHLLDGPPAAWWAERMRLAGPDEARGYLVAALREVWEETGVVIGEAGAGAAAARGALLDDDAALAALLARAGVRFDTGRLLYLAHWITPEAEPRRFDTRFFAARVAADTACELRGDELVEACWIPPAEAVRRYGDGEIKLLPPTVETLRRLAAHDTADAIWAALLDAEVTPVLPRMRRTEEGVEIRFSNES